MTTYIILIFALILVVLFIVINQRFSPRRQNEQINIEIPPNEDDIKNNNDLSNDVNGNENDIVVEDNAQDEIVDGVLKPNLPKLTNSTRIIKIPASGKEFKIKKIYTSTLFNSLCDIKLDVLSSNNGIESTTIFKVSKSKIEDYYYYYDTLREEKRINNNGINIYIECDLPTDAKITVKYTEKEFRS
jgi:hypothetical protein